jgi:hypothetical protein
MQSWSDRASATKVRSRIEAICLRRELNFVAKLPHSGLLREEIARTLEWCASDQDYWSNVSFRQRRLEGASETLRYLGVPSWFVRVLLGVRAVTSAVHRLHNHFFGCSRQA